MINNEQQAQQVVIRHIGGFAWPTLLLLVACAGIYLACVWQLITDASFSWGRWQASLCAVTPFTPLFMMRSTVLLAE